MNDYGNDRAPYQTNNEQLIMKKTDGKNAVGFLHVVQVNVCNSK
jgi:hypothetical protein